jgi:transcriptional regulator with XRE-family HTH domain
LPGSPPVAADVPPVAADLQLRVTLRRLRRASGLTQRALLKPLCLASHSSIVDYESGRRVPPRDIVAAYERFFALPAGQLQQLRSQALAAMAAREAAATLTAGSGPARGEAPAAPPPPAGTGVVEPAQAGTGTAISR